MGKKKTKKFIDPKKDVLHTFKIISRSQKDPLIADQTAPQGVLVNDETQPSKSLPDYGVYFDDDYNYLQHLRGVKESVEWENSDMEVYTICNEDKELKNASSRGLVLPSSVFESHVEEPIGLLNKAAPVTGPQPDLDPDIVAELDRLSVESVDNVEGDIPDDFIMMLNSEEPIECDQFEQEGSNANVNSWLNNTAIEYDDIPDTEALDGGLSYKKRELFTLHEDSSFNNGLNSDEEVEENEDFGVSDDENESQHRDNRCSKFLRNVHSNSPVNEEEPPSNFYDPLGYGGNSQNYVDDKRGKFSSGNEFDNKSRTSTVSHSCSVLPRHGLLPWLDDRYDYVMSNEYSKDKWGALDGEEIRGQFDLDSAVFKNAFEVTKRQLAKMNMDDREKDDEAINWVKKYNSGADSDKVEYVRIPRPQKEKYNCETMPPVDTSYKNQPTIINWRTGEEIRPKIDINKKRGYPNLDDKSTLTKKAVLQHNKLANSDTDSADEEENDAKTLKSMLSMVSYRPKGETPEERRERKKALKELRRERRIERRLNKEAFKEEKKKQAHDMLNARRGKMMAVI